MYYPPIVNQTPWYNPYTPCLVVVMHDNARCDQIPFLCRDIVKLE